jgi:hypothetical protein
MSQPSPRIYIDSESLFTLQVPPGWLVDTSGQQGARVILLHPSSADDFRVNVTVQNIQALTHDEYLPLTRLQFKQLTGPGRPPTSTNPARTRRALTCWNGPPRSARSPSPPAS